MLRRILTFLFAFVIAVSGYQPSYGMTGAAPATAVSASMDDDCRKSMPDDHCEKTDQTKQHCQWNDVCAARCHINVGLEAVFAAPALRQMTVTSMAFVEPPRLHPVRAGPHFRPPVI